LIENFVTGNAEIIKVADALASEKNIDKELVISSLEEAFEFAAKKKYGADHNISVKIDIKTGGIHIFREILVVKLVENMHQEISVLDAKKNNNDAKIGDTITYDLPPINLGRLNANIVKQIILHNIKNAEREKQFDYYKDKVSQIIVGVVKKVSYSGMLVDVGGAEAFISRGDSIPTEKFYQNDRVKCIIKEVIRKEAGTQIYLSRSSNEFMEQLFIQEVPEIYEGIIKIVSIARDAGSRAKIAVQAVDSNLDPVGACVGVRGSRVQVVINELKGEKIDIIEWSADPARFVINSMVPAQVAKVVVDEEQSKIDVVVAEKDYSIAIGRKGQNVKLASLLTKWRINILNEQEDYDLRKQELNRIHSIFLDVIGLDDITAHLLISEGLTDFEEILEISKEDLLQIDGLSEKSVELLMGNSKKFVKTKDHKKYQWESFELDDSLISIKDINVDIAVALAKQNVRTLQQLADLSRDEFLELVDSEIVSDTKIIDSIIMCARELLFKQEENNLQSE
jgi:transcription termination/antitermination protein NusA